MCVCVCEWSQYRQDTNYDKLINYSLYCIVGCIALHVQYTLHWMSIDNTAAVIPHYSPSLNNISLPHIAILRTHTRGEEEEGNTTQQ